MQQRLSAAYRRFGISSSFQQKLFAYFLFCYRFALHELFQFLQVFIGIKGNALSFTPVSSGTSCFLIISFQTFRNVIVNDITYIGLINTHTESNGCHNHIYFLHQEVILILRTCCRIHACMVSAGIDAVCLQNLSKFLYFLPAQAINNT